MPLKRNSHKRIWIVNLQDYPVYKLTNEFVFTCRKYHWLFIPKRNITTFIICLLKQESWVQTSIKDGDRQWELNFMSDVLRSNKATMSPCVTGQSQCDVFLHLMFKSFHQGEKYLPTLILESLNRWCSMEVETCTWGQVLALQILWVIVLCKVHALDYLLIV
jgi:hypothetical protein